MCDFISWVEKDGEVLFLTDKEVYSKRGRELFGDCKDNDVLGHGAIRKYYGKDGKLLVGGWNHEEGFFWKVERLPKEIQSLHPEYPDQFMQRWGRMWNGGFFQNDDLRYIICYAPEAWKEKAAEQLMQQNPSNDDLRDIIEYAPEAWKEKAREELKKRKAL